MTALLASVRNLEEANLVVAAGCDWLDLKEPSAGALGALSVACVAEIVTRYHGRLPISATIGDCWDSPGEIPVQVSTMMATGVDYLKIGLFADRITIELERALRTAISAKPELIAVCFAEAFPESGDIARLAALGFKGVMLDTANKSQGALSERVSLTALAWFISIVHGHGLLAGLAGGLRAQDIADLLPLEADYLGFRTALCRDRRRTAELDRTAIANVRHLLTTSRVVKTHSEEKLHELA
jgi:(5-formylfuran-3-yl)methyl phosphate synthase